ncbi:MAG: hypothetical protein U1E81_16125 [Xanthobacteraceae bacterium]
MLITEFIAAVREHPRFLAAAADDPGYAEHMAAFEDGLAALRNSDDPRAVAATDDIVDIVRDGDVTRAKIFAVVRVLQHFLHGPTQ